MKSVDTIVSARSTPSQKRRNPTARLVKLWYNLLAMETVISILTRFVADAAWCCADSPRVDCTFPTGNEMTLALAREPGRSTWFHTEMFLADAALQREIQHQLTIDHQKEMDEALKSSGNAALRA